MTFRIESQPFAVTGESFTIFCFPSSRLRVDGMPSRIQRATWSRQTTTSAVRSSSTRRRPKTGISRVRTLPQRSRLFDDESFPSATLPRTTMPRTRSRAAATGSPPRRARAPRVEAGPGPEWRPRSSRSAHEARARTGPGGPCAGPSLEPERSSRRPSASRCPGATSAPSRSASAAPIGSSPRRNASRSPRLHVSEPVFPRRPTG